MNIIPTPWLSVPGAEAALIGGKLVVRLPAWLIPTRRYCRVHVMRGATHFSIAHEETFIRPQSGRNAWQGDWHDSGTSPGIKARQLDRPLGRIQGDLQTLDNMFDPFGTFFKMDVRVVPEGFMLQPASLGMGQPLAPVTALMNAIMEAPYHGGQHTVPVRSKLALRREVVDLESQIFGPRTREAYIRVREARIKAIGRYELRHKYTEDELLKYRDYLRPYTLPHKSAAGGPVSLPNCRCVYPTLTENQETDTMRKIDTTTAETVPASLVSSEAIVRCTFEGSSKEYGYFSGGLKLEVGDSVVVASPYPDGVFDNDCGGHLTVVKVASVEENVEAIERAAKWIIQKVDTTEYVARRKRIEAIRTIDARIKRAAADAQKRIELEALKAVSPELTALLAERDALSKPAVAE